MGADRHVVRWGAASHTQTAGEGRLPVVCVPHARPIHLRAASLGASHPTLAAAAPLPHHAQSTTCAASVELNGGLLAFVR